MDHDNIHRSSDPIFDALSTAFLTTFKSQPGSYFNPSLRIVDLRSRNAGRGIVAADDIPADTDLFVIPRDYVISVETSALSRKLPQLFNENDDDDDDVDDIVEDAEDALTELPKPWLNLILVLLYEYFHRETSKWRDYWAVLPESFDTLMFWSEDELAELQASASRAKIGKDDADRMFRKKILPVVTESSHVFHPDHVEPLDEDGLLNLAHRMGSLIMAYAFDLQNEGEQDEDAGEDGWMEDREGTTAMGMVAMADMLNADAEFNAHLEHGERELTMRSLREIKKGEEVLNCYGPLPNSDLLRRYGYTSRRHARYDVVEISWRLVCDQAREVLGSLPPMDTEDEELEESFVLERESGDPDETGVNTTKPRFTTFPEELVEQTTTLVSTALNISGKPDEGQKLKLKQFFLQIMAKVLAARLAEYQTSVEQDQVLIEQHSAAGRAKMAIDVRIGEKHLLREAQQLVVELLQKYSGGENGSTATSERPSKKRRTDK